MALMLLHYAAISYQLSAISFQHSAFSTLHLAFGQPASALRLNAGAVPSSSQSARATSSKCVALLC